MIVGTGAPARGQAPSLSRLAVPAVVKIGLTDRPITFAGLYVATARGYFRDANITNEFVAVGGINALVGPLATGDIDIGTGGVSAGLFNAIERGIKGGVPVERIIDLMHVLVVRKSVVAEHGDLPRALFDLFVRSKQAGRDWLRMDPSLGIVWKNAYLEQEREIFGGDPWRYGLAENQHGLETFLRYCHDLGISARRVSPRDLFEPSTWALQDDA